MTALAFLDDHTVGQSHQGREKPISSTAPVHSETAGSFWKHALTATDHNTEIKLWRCDDWSCVQRICFRPTVPNAVLDFKLDIDASSSYLVLSEQQNRVLYALQIGQQEEGEEKETGELKADGKGATGVTSNVAFRSVGEFPLGSSILSFNIAGAIKGKYNCGRLEDDLEMDEEEGYDGEAEDDPLCQGVMIRMFLVQPKSVQECHVFYQTESPAQPESGECFRLYFIFIFC